MSMHGFESKMGDEVPSPVGKRRGSCWSVELEVLNDKMYMDGTK